MPPKPAKRVKKNEEIKTEDVKTKSGDEYFKSYRIIDETEMSFYCPMKQSGDVRTWFGGFEWTFAKYGKDKASLKCNFSWEKDKKALVDLYFYCRPDKEARLPITSCTFKRKELIGGEQIEVTDEMNYGKSATWGVYIRLLKKWDLGKRSWNNHKSRHTLKYVIRGREFYVLKDFMASTSAYIENNMDEDMSDEVSILNIDHDPHEFNIFLHAIDGQDPVLPAPDTLRSLCAYADDYSVPTLATKCEKHLKYCHEIPLLERLKMSFEFEYKNAQSYLMEMMTSSEWTRAKRGDGQEMFDELLFHAPGKNFYEWIFDREHLW